MGRKAKLTWDDKLLIFALYFPKNARPLTLDELGEKFEVSAQTVWRALKEIKESNDVNES